MMSVRWRYRILRTFVVMLVVQGYGQYKSMISGSLKSDGKEREIKCSPTHRQERIYTFEIESEIASSAPTLVSYHSSRCHHSIHELHDLRPNMVKGNESRPEDEAKNQSSGGKTTRQLITHGALW